MQFLQRTCPILLAGILLVTGCAADPEPTTMDTPEASQPASDHAETATPSKNPDPIELGTVEVIAQGLTTPWSVAFAGDTPVLSERDNARIVALNDEGTVRELAVVDQATPGGEGGLLGIVIHQDKLLAYLTTATDNRILSFDLSGAGETLALGKPEVLLDGIPASDYHNGGRLGIGPDGMLYATTGDALEPSGSQDLDSLAGKILRITPSGDIPDDNPFENSPVYSYGHRNPQGIAWAADGTMYASEFGQDDWDELNAIEPGGNYGWPEVEGAEDQEEFIDPVQQWIPKDASPSGIEINDGTLLMAALRGERLWAIPLDDVTTSNAYFEHEYGRLRDVATAPDGSIWVLTSNTDGNGAPTPVDDRILRIEVQ
ncbi:PQQ-dependent sugar dehydrogenase [Enteractinococcus coprophilus]|uniref:Glucose/arabinose dehydrogenase n=1 Tax=Enteractinococcus coprophilus TaxID=1027633 RepID=A0A543AMM7_9MICC|nr:PQQ-dependent sugar dehydrogenase [Enteractinococcus coprophilus]TQL73840.1 glucose/arabinose dehydrogenase [Enteractinococcus coprophilus]